MLDGSLGAIDAALKKGSFAEGIVLALARTKRGLPLRERDLFAIREAGAFLRSAEEGLKWIEKPEVNPESRRNALNLETAARSSSLSVPPATFEAELRQMRETLEGISQGAQVRADQLEKSTAFFNRVFESVVDGIDDLLLTSSKPKLDRWMLLTHYAL